MDIIKHNEVVVNRIESIKKLEAYIKSSEQVVCPIRDRFIEKMYMRECTLPIGVLVVSKLHKTEHPFVISKGAVSVFTDEEGWVYIEAPYTGVTKPNTKRVVYAHEETIWTTFHVTNKKTVEDVENEIIQKEDIKEEIVCHG